MQYTIAIKGESPLLMSNAVTGLDTRSPDNIEKSELTRKKSSNRTAVEDARIRELETKIGLWLDDEGSPTIPPKAFRTLLEKSARKLKQGGDVREGCVVEETLDFTYDTEKTGETISEIMKKGQFVTDVVVNNSRVLKARPIFYDWSAKFKIDVDDQLIDKAKLTSWLDIGGRRLGIGSWRPEKSGIFGRFSTVSIDEVT